MSSPGSSASLRECPTYYFAVQSARARLYESETVEERNLLNAG
jgi:hypothetical protein